MVLNRNIKSIRGGESTEPETYGILLKLAQEAPFKHAQAEYLPKPLVFFGKSIIICFKSTRHPWSIFLPGRDRQVKSIWAKVEDFKSLKKITFTKPNHQNLWELDIYCTNPSLKSLALLVNVASIDHAPSNQEEMKQWCLKHGVKEVNALKSLELVSFKTPYSVTILFFLLYKFSKLDTSVLKGLKIYYNYQTFLNAIKHIPNINLHC